MIDVKQSDDVPIPRKGSKYPFETLTEIGKSLFFPKANMSVVSSSVWIYAKRTGNRYTVRTIKDGALWGCPGEPGVAVWRVE